MGKNIAQMATEKYSVNIIYGDKSLVQCMANVIRRLLVKSAEKRNEM